MQSTETTREPLKLKIDTYKPPSCRIFVEGVVSFRPFFSGGKNEKLSAVIRARNGDEYQIRFSHENPFQQEVMNRYKDRKIRCYGDIIGKVFVAKVIVPLT